MLLVLFWVCMQDGHMKYNEVYEESIAPQASEAS